MLTKLSYKLSVVKTILLTALLMAGVQLSAQAYTVQLNPLDGYITTGITDCPLIGGTEYDRNKCSAIFDLEDKNTLDITTNLYLYQRVEWIDVTSRTMTNAEKAKYVTATTLSVHILDPAVKYLHSVLDDPNLVSHATFDQQKSNKDRVLLLGIYDRINGALRIIGHRIIYGQLASYSGGVTLSVSNFQVHTQRTSIGPSHFDYLQSTNAWLDPTDHLLGEKPGINPFVRFRADDGSGVFYNINFGAAIVAMSKARALVNADVAYMMVVNYDGFQNDLNINNIGNVVIADAGFQGVRTEIELYYEWFRLFNHEKELGNLLGQAFSSAFCIRKSTTANPCKDYEIVSSDDSVLYLDHFTGASGLSTPHIMDPIDSTKATQITPKSPINDSIINYIFLATLTLGHDYVSSGNPLAPDSDFLTATLKLTPEEVKKINASAGHDGYFINSFLLTFDGVVWEQRAATHTDFADLLHEEWAMNEGYAFTSTLDYDPMSAGSPDATFAAVGGELYDLFVKEDDLEKSDIAALQCFATADDPHNSNNKSWYEKGCGQVGKSEFFLDKNTATQNVKLYQDRSKNIRGNIDYYRREARDGNNPNLPTQAYATPAEALVEMRKGTTIVLNGTGGAVGSVVKSGGNVTATIGGQTYLIDEKRALRLFYRYPPSW